MWEGVRKESSLGTIPLVEARDFLSPAEFPTSVAFSRNHRSI